MLLQGQPTSISGRVLTSGCVLSAKNQQNRTELVWLLEGIQLEDTSLANLSLIIE